MYNFLRLEMQYRYCKHSPRMTEVPAWAGTGEWQHLHQRQQHGLLCYVHSAALAPGAQLAAALAPAVPPLLGPGAPMVCAALGAGLRADRGQQQRQAVVARQARQLAGLQAAAVADAPQLQAWESVGRSNLACGL